MNGYETLHVVCPEMTQEQKEEQRLRSIEMWRAHCAGHPDITPSLVWQVITSRGGEMIYGAMPDA